MNNFVRRLLIFLAALVIVLAIWRFYQSRQEKAYEAARAQAEYKLMLERARADDLLSRLQNLKAVREQLVMPQVEVSIKL